jgi:AraC-like DNA-binding protein
MDWIKDTQKAINYIEEHLLDNINADDTANCIFSSSGHFQKMFRIVTGVSVSEYIRNRRLSLAGQELKMPGSKVLNTALKYGYETPESFAKAFYRFHGINPSEAQDSEKLKYYSPLTVQVFIKGGFTMSRKLISNIEKLWENHAENYMFPSCMRSVMGALSEPKEMDFIFFAGVTGDLFTQIWIEPKWQYNDSYSNVCKDTLLPVQSAFNACGYSFEYIYKDDIVRTKRECIQKIVESIDKGLPVLTFGIVGPPVCSIICGYDENGEILIGWSQFTDEQQHDIPTDLVTSENYFSQRNGLDRSEALIFFKKKEKTADIAESCRKSVLSIPVLSSLSPYENMQRKVYFGNNAFDKWADSLMCGEYFQNEDMLVNPLDTYGSCMVLAGTNMHFIQEYLDRALKYCPDMHGKIKRLKEVYAEENEALQKIVEFQGGYFFDADRKALLDRNFRIKLSELVKKTGECYKRAAHVLDK